MLSPRLDTSSGAFIVAKEQSFAGDPTPSAAYTPPLGGAEQAQAEDRLQRLGSIAGDRINIVYSKSETTLSYRKQKHTRPASKSYGDRNLTTKSDVEMNVLQYLGNVAGR
jgi:hypothetical protein